MGLYSEMPDKYHFLDMVHGVTSYSLVPIWMEILFKLESQVIFQIYNVSIIHLLSSLGFLAGQLCMVFHPTIPHELFTIQIRSCYENVQCHKNLG